MEKDYNLTNGNSSPSLRKESSCQFLDKRGDLIEEEFGCFWKSN